MKICSTSTTNFSSIKPGWPWWRWRAGNCMGCHMKLTTQTAVRVKNEKEIVHCEQCGRILYYSE